MARQKEPIALIQAKGKSHKTKAEIAEREKSEIKPVTEGIEPPEMLTTSKQRASFNDYAEKLKRLGVFGETDCDVLAMYVLAVEQYDHCMKMLRTKEAKEDFTVYAYYAKQQDKFCKQCHELAKSLGLTPTARCKLSIPTVNEGPKVNRFAKFSVSERVSGDD